jgi:hypothetical protein
MAIIGIILLIVIFILFCMLTYYAMFVWAKSLNWKNNNKGDE